MKVAVGISGGVDSAVAALILKEQGHEVVGVTMTLGRADEAKSLAEAKAAAERLGIPLRVFDFTHEWNSCVLDYIRATYLGGKTPNPCVRCNETVKFGLLPRAAFEMGCERFATGHYARVLFKHRDTETQRAGQPVGSKLGAQPPGPTHNSVSPCLCVKNPVLCRAVDKAKDQSYFLYRVRSEILEKTIFPLGEMTKDEVRAKARAFGLEVAEKGDSQDFCGGDPMRIVNEPDREGEVVTVDGKVIGRHRGYWNYTVGMRKGLGIGGGTPYYVVALDAVKNRVIVGFKENAVRYDLELTDTVGVVDKSLPVKVRSAGEPKLLRDGIAGIAPGQSAVFYDGDIVVGGGIITMPK